MYSAKSTSAQVYGIGVSMKRDIATIYKQHNLSLISGTMIFDARGDPNNGFVLKIILDFFEISQSRQVRTPLMLFWQQQMVFTVCLQSLPFLRAMLEIAGGYSCYSYLGPC